MYHGLHGRSTLLYQNVSATAQCYANVGRSSWNHLQLEMRLTLFILPSSLFQRRLKTILLQHSLGLGVPSEISSLTSVSLKTLYFLGSITITKLDYDETRQFIRLTDWKQREVNNKDRELLQVAQKPLLQYVSTTTKHLCCSGKQNNTVNLHHK